MFIWITSSSTLLNTWKLIYHSFLLPGYTLIDRKFKLWGMLLVCKLMNHLLALVHMFSVHLHTFFMVTCQTVFLRSLLIELHNVHYSSLLLLISVASKGNTISTGLITGIGVGCGLLLLGLVGVGIYAFRQKKLAERAKHISQPFGM